MDRIDLKATSHLIHESALFLENHSPCVSVQSLGLADNVHFVLTKFGLFRALIESEIVLGLIA